jgi:hypothetical protein
MSLITVLFHPSAFSYLYIFIFNLGSGMLKVGM